MKVGSCLVIIMLFVGNGWGMDVFDFFKRMPGNVKSVSISSTDMVIDFNKSSVLQIALNREPYTFRHSREYAANNEPLILVPNKEITLVSRHSAIYFHPVTFRNQHTGFKIINEVDNRSIRRGITTNIIVYVALSDTFVEVGEDDVEMIMEKGEWKTYENKQSAPKEESEGQEPPPNLEPLVTTTQGKTLTNVSENAPNETEPKIRPLWLYALIPFCLITIFCFLRRKRK